MKTPTELTDEFAVAAMQALVTRLPQKGCSLWSGASSAPPFSDFDPATVTQIGKLAYDIALAMMRERAERTHQARGGAS